MCIGVHPDCKCPAPVRLNKAAAFGDDILDKLAECDRESKICIVKNAQGEIIEWYRDVEAELLER